MQARRERPRGWRCAGPGCTASLASPRRSPRSGGGGVEVGHGEGQAEEPGGPVARRLGGADHLEDGVAQAEEDLADRAPVGLALPRPGGPRARSPRGRPPCGRGRGSSPRRGRWRWCRWGGARRRRAGSAGAGRWRGEPVDRPGRCPRRAQRPHAPCPCPGVSVTADVAEPAAPGVVHGEPERAPGARARRPPPGRPGGASDSHQAAVRTLEHGEHGTLALAEAGLRLGLAPGLGQGAVDVGVVDAGVDVAGAGHRAGVAQVGRRRRRRRPGSCAWPPSCSVGGPDLARRASAATTVPAPGPEVLGREGGVGHGPQVLVDVGRGDVAHLAGVVEVLEQVLAGQVLARPGRCGPGAGP